MSDYRKGKWVRTPYTSPLRLNHDDKKGLGYGVLDPQYDDPRQSQGYYPYLDPDVHVANEEEMLDDEELDVFVAKTNAGYLPSDFLAPAFTDPFYFVAGNTKISDCIYRENNVSFESTSGKTPMHELVLKETGLSEYRGRKHGPMLRTGTAFPYPGGGGTSYKRTGSVSGYSHSPPPLAVDPELGQFAVHNLRDMPDASERTLSKLYVLIADIIRQQEEAQGENQ
jgi:hypothetical protein